MVSNCAYSYNGCLHCDVADLYSAQFLLRKKQMDGLCFQCLADFKCNEGHSEGSIIIPLEGCSAADLRKASEQIEMVHKACGRTPYRTRLGKGRDSNLRIELRKRKAMKRKPIRRKPIQKPAPRKCRRRSWCPYYDSIPSGRIKPEKYLYFKIPLVWYFVYFLLSSLVLTGLFHYEYLGWKA